MLPMLRRNWSVTEVCWAFCTKKAAAAGLSAGRLTLCPEAICCRSLLICCWFTPSSASRSGNGLEFTRIWGLSSDHVDHDVHQVADGGDNFSRGRVGPLK